MKWKRQIELLLLHHDILNLINGDRVKPNDPGIVATTEQRESFETKVKAFKKSDALAQLILVGSMDNANVELTSTCDSAKSTWNKLISIYELSSEQRVDRLMGQFFSFGKDPSENVVTHIARLQRNSSELNDELKR
ncbi:hypothetical protein AVEN_240193-1 [Araneus ventricosus]|uniref:Retrovirus-related Pol polyprotein from transposon TNT 1-94 n=1 Tax=Araneus ventricosus TaxID=182803 RepID=A0A4Y2V3R7_ARAVE|nr:hypothetical protein AVEN_240193-1 [Araneus ventricosus]